MRATVLSPLLLNIFFTAPLEAMLGRLSKDAVIVNDLVHPEEEGADGKRATPLKQRVRKAVWGMLYTDDAACGSR